MATLICPSPAKLNLFLRIIGQREDSYHLLQTIFQFIDFSDTLIFKKQVNSILEIKGNINNVALEDNLIYKAAVLLKDFTQTRQGVSIEFHKKIPLGGGLGGGSSNAATVLLALNKLWELDLSLDELAQIGLTLGADVPVFIHGNAAWAEGIGEKLFDISLPEPWYIVIIPPCHVSTMKIFSNSQLTRDATPCTIRVFNEETSYNDCEPLVRKLYPQIDTALNWLNQYTKAILTGTGACIFGHFTELEKAKCVLNKIPAGFAGFIAKGINSSPLHHILGYR
ncbi:MAG: 4-diphosphocytidyl-2-C-methyl-D-erythritol kinase [Legionellaceae bacterium]